MRRIAITERVFHRSHPLRPAYCVNVKQHRDAGAERDHLHAVHAEPVFWGKADSLQWEHGGGGPGGERAGEPGERGAVPVLSLRGGGGDADFEWREKFVTPKSQPIRMDEYAQHRLCCWIGL